MVRCQKPKREDASLATVADRLVVAAREILQEAKTEEDLKIKFERVLGPLVENAGIVFEERYERGSAAAKTVLKGKRPDALHGQVVVEYEAPDSFKSHTAVEHAYGQLTEYVSAEAKAARKEDVAGPVGIVGVGFDGSSVFFVRCRNKGPTAKEKAGGFAFVMDGPYMFGPESALTFVTYLRALARLALTAENLADKFGPKAGVAREAVGAFADAMANWPTQRAKVFFQEWQRLFGIVYGEQFGGGSDKKTAALAETYGLSIESDFQTMLFCVHTYFALLMKLIAAELVSISEGTFGRSFSSALAHSSKEDLLKQLTDVEEGGIYSKRGISNFLEGDFFRWYLEAFDSPRLLDAIRSITRVLSEFEPATATIEPEVTHDLLKRLYQYLVPDAVRHHLGEYYTPDWLAELVLDEAGYGGDTKKRVLDPACGSGTFLVLVIQRAREFGAKRNEPVVETTRRILANVWGFDLNPLAVLAARTNYLFAMGKLADRLGAFEIPVYLADSVLWPKRTGQMMLIGNGAVEITTSVGTFFVPKIWVEQHGFLMKRAAPIVEETARMKWDVPEAMARFKKEGLVYPPHENVVADFYEHILELERDGKNGIWARFLKNVFAPMTAERFDYVVGNPPWIRWGYLSSEYRQATMEMWQEYGLFSLKGHAARLGGGEKDFSMLFTYAAADHYLAGSGTLGFLITQEVFKSKGAGEGFRKFRLGDRETLKVVKAHDLASVQPFEKAANKTAAIILKKRGHTQYPVPYTVWTRKKGIGRVPTNLKLKAAKKLLDRQVLSATPIGKINGSWQTVRKGDGRLRHIEGENAYKARRGASTEPYGVFWLDVREILSTGNLIVRNLVEKGKRRIRQVEVRIEPDLVYPAVRGADIKRWVAHPEIHVLMVQDPQRSEPYSEKMMKENWPYTFNYLTQFRKVLLSRGSRTVRELAERTEFYAMFGIGPYTVARYKVVWKRMAGDLVAAVIGRHKTPFGWKMIVPTDTTSLFATDRQDEAHYLCAILNSSPVRDFVKSYSSAGRGFGAPSVMEHVGIPTFDGKNKNHGRLSELSRELHRLRADDKEVETGKMEKAVDDAVWALFEGRNR
ncbi:MAG TPA: SAM-dependent DNA methyltransferase [Phycisphaerales bacterium]|nr:SAM-dependent DNA methyltransferase [Phycisphaerales bacterium]